MTLTINAKILLVCAQEKEQKAILGMLRELNFERVTVAADGREALQILDTERLPFQLIISACDLPRVSGLNLLREVRTSQPTLPFILTSHEAYSDAVLTACEYGVSAFLKWPFKLRHLQEKINLIQKYGSSYHVPMGRSRARKSAG